MDSSSFDPKWMLYRFDQAVFSFFHGLFAPILDTLMAWPIWLKLTLYSLFLCFLYAQVEGPRGQRILGQITPTRMTPGIAWNAVSQTCNEAGGGLASLAVILLCLPLVAAPFMLGYALPVGITFHTLKSEYDFYSLSSMNRLFFIVAEVVSVFTVGMIIYRCLLLFLSVILLFAIPYFLIHWTADGIHALFFVK